LFEDRVVFEKTFYIKTNGKLTKDTNVVNKNGNDGRRNELRKDKNNRSEEITEKRKPKIEAKKIKI